MPRETVDYCVGALCRHAVRVCGRPGASRAAGTRRGIAFRRRIEDCCCFARASRHRQDLRRRRRLSRCDARGRHKAGDVERNRSQSEKGCAIGRGFPPGALRTAGSGAGGRGWAERFVRFTVGEKPRFGRDVCAMKNSSLAQSSARGRWMDADLSHARVAKFPAEFPASGFDLYILDSPRAPRKGRAACPFRLAAMPSSKPATPLFPFFPAFFPAPGKIVGRDHSSGLVLRHSA